MADVEVKVLPGYFPLVRRACAEPGARFMFCFSEKGRQALSGDGGAARRGLAQCQTELRAYSQCMEQTPAAK